MKQVGIALTIALALGHRSRAGVISLDGEDFHQQQDPEQHDSLATSYLQFHGPVEGPVYEVKVPYSVNHGDNSNDLHGHEQQGEQHGYSFDYVAHPKYEFSYGVEDHRTGDFHGQKERRDGEPIKSLSFSSFFSTILHRNVLHLRCEDLSASPLRARFVSNFVSGTTVAGKRRQLDRKV